MVMCELSQGIDLRTTNKKKEKTQMKNTNTKAFNDNLKAYLAPIIQDHAEDYGEPTPPANLYQWAIDTAKKEVGHAFAQHGDQKGLEYWLSGLALNVACYYSEIIETAEKIHECTLTDKERGMVCERWFNFLAAKMMQYARK